LPRKICFGLRYGTAYGNTITRQSGLTEFDATRRFVVDEPASGDFRPPYLSFKTFWSFLDEMLSNPVPPQIDRSLMRSKSGSDQLHLTSALKAFGLIDASQTVTGLRELASTDEQGRIRWLAAQLRQRYPSQVKVSEDNGTEQQLRESLRESFKIASADTLRKAMTFFLHAARTAGISISPHFPTTRSGSGAPGTSKPKRSASRRKTAAGPASENGSGKAGTREGDTYSVELVSGGSVSVVVTVNLFALSTADRTFVIDLVDKLKGYDSATPESEQSAATPTGVGPDMT
jgi:hypothetical protein